MSNTSAMTNTKTAGQPRRSRAARGLVAALAMALAVPLAALAPNAATAADPPPTQRVHVSALTGGQQLLDPATGSSTASFEATDATISPDGAKFASVNYSSRGGQTYTEIQVYAAGSSFTVAEVQGGIEALSWSSDSSRLAAQTTSFGTDIRTSVISMPAVAGATVTELVVGTDLLVTGAAWRPGTNSIAFIRNGNVELVPATGGSPTMYYEATEYSVNRISWSADGGSILGHLSRYNPVAGDSENLIGRVTPGGVTRLATLANDPDGGYLIASAFGSPDGRLIAYERAVYLGDERRIDVYLMSADGTGNRQVAQDAQVHGWQLCADGRCPDFGDRTPRDRCLDGAPVPPTFTGTTSKTPLSRTVTFRVGTMFLGSSYRIAWGDGTSSAVRPGTVQHTYGTAGQFSATLTATDINDCTATAAVGVTADPVTTYTPTYYHHPREKYFPDSASTFLSRSQLVHMRPRVCAPRKFLAAGAQARQEGADQGRLRVSRMTGRGAKAYTGPRLKTMKAQTGATPNGPLRTICRKVGGTVRANQNPDTAFVRAKKIHTSGFYLNLLNKEAWRKGSLDRARVYYRLKPAKSTAYAAIEYWVFSPYNKWQNNGITEIHEGDWEHVVVRIKDTGRATNALFFQHNCTPKPVAWDKVVRDPQASTHPLVMPALGGHASYNDSPARVGANEDVSNCSVKGTRTADDFIGYKAGDSKEWRPWQKSQLSNVTKQGWYGFGGSWGDRSSRSSRIPGVDNYGPPAPHPKK